MVGRNLSHRAKVEIGNQIKKSRSTKCEFISSTAFFVMGVLLTLKGCDAISNAMPSAWFSLDTFVALVHFLFLHDLYPLLKKFLSLSALSIILSVFPLSFATVPSLSRSYNTDDPPSLPHWTVCLSFWQQILAHQNFSRVCTTFLLRHCHVSTDRLRLLRQSSRGRKRLHTLNLEVNPPPPIYRD